MRNQCVFLELRRPTTLADDSPAFRELHMAGPGTDEWVTSPAVPMSPAMSMATAFQYLQKKGYIVEKTIEMRSKEDGSLRFALFPEPYRVKG